MLPISFLKKVLDKKLGANTWKEFEVETLLSELVLQYHPVLADKLNVLKVIEHNPSIFFDDLLFFINSTNVMNDEVSDFEFLPHLTSLEIAFAITELASILEVDAHHLPEFQPEVVAFIRDTLINEGYSEVLPPFDVVGLGALPKGQTSQDTSDKATAIKEYIHAMVN
jgi:hypothetical protein